MTELNGAKLPRHVAIVMDGNGRWATKRGLPRSAGHKEGAKAFRRISDYATELGIEVLTFYAFSTENWMRPQQEVDALMNIFRDFLHESEEREKENEQKGIRARFIGKREGLPEDILELIDRAEKKTRDAHRTTVNIAVNYGARDEILTAVQRVAQLCVSGEKRPEDLTQEDVAANLYTAGQPDPDLMIRPSGEMRISNFLLWQSAYTEFWYSDILWPDFTVEDFNKALADYANRSRRFGGV